VDLIKRLATEAGFTGCTEIWGLGFPTDSIEEAESAAPEIKLLFDLAQMMGSPVVVITGGKRQTGGLEATIAGIKKLVPLISQIPAKLAIEPHYHSQIRDEKDYDEIFQQLESMQIGITIDTGNFHAIGVDWKALIRRYADRIYNIHVKDNIGMQGVPLGRGEVDLKGLVEELHAIDYEGPLSIELEVEDYENVPRYCSEAFNYLTKLIGEVAHNKN
jgi:sugar phosphate isomerase/epimerase